MNNPTPTTVEAIHRDLSFDLIHPGARVPSWATLGMSFDDPQVSVADAFQQAGLAYPINQEPLYVNIDGEFVAVENHTALVRGDTNAIIDVVTNRYEAIDNMKLASYLEPIRQWGQLSHAGFLGKGEAIFAVFKGPQFEIAVKDRHVGDMLQFNAVAYEDKRSGNALRIDIVPIRFVCVNGQVIPVFGDAIFTPIAHNSGVNAIASWTGKALGALGRLEATIKERFNVMANVKIDDRQVEAVFEKAWPLPERSRKENRVLQLIEAAEAHQAVDEAATRMLNQADKQYELDLAQVSLHRNTAWQTYQDEIESQGIAGTAWGAYNAVTAVIDHKGNGKKTARSAIFGDGAQVKVRAFRAAMEFSKN